MQFMYIFYNLILSFVYLFVLTSSAITLLTSGFDPWRFLSGLASVLAMAILLKLRTLKTLVQTGIGLAIIATLTLFIFNNFNSNIGTLLALISLSSIENDFLKILSWYLPFFILLLSVHHLLILPREKSNKSNIPGLFKAMFHFTGLLIPTLLTISTVFGISLTGLLATSGLLTAIIGLALQANLSHIFSGLFLNIEQPFVAGEWVTITDYKGKEGITGYVMDVSWRSTRLRTNENIEISIPNANVAQSTIINWNRNDKNTCEGHIFHLYLSFHPGHDASFLVELLKDSLARVKPADGRAELNKQSVKLIEVNEFGLKFDISFDCIDRSLKSSQENVVLLSIQHVMNNAGISVTTGLLEHSLDTDIGLTALSNKSRSVNDYHHVVKSSSNIYFEALNNEIPLRQINLFQSLSDNEIKKLSENCNRVRFGIGEHIVRQGDHGSSMFVITEGVSKIEIKKDDGTKIEVARLGVGDFFGEMSLLTGAMRSADVIVVRPLVVLEIEKEVIKPFLETNPIFLTRRGK